MVIKLCILFGGKSIEHDVSVLSAKNLIPFFDREKYALLLVGIDRQGLWHLVSEEFKWGEPKPFYTIFSQMVDWGVQVIFPVFHGLNGEDGTIQGLLEIADLPYVGPNVLGAAIGLDKDVMKRLLRDAKIPITDFLVFQELPDYQEVKAQLGDPIYIKPANMGSTLGMSIAYSAEEFTRGFTIAKKYDPKVICERKVFGRELECSVIGLNQPVASLPCEIETKTGTYSYMGKYFDRSLTNYIYPAKKLPIFAT